MRIKKKEICLLDSEEEIMSIQRFVLRRLVGKAINMLVFNSVVNVGQVILLVNIRRLMIMSVICCAQRIQKSLAVQLGEIVSTILKILRALKTYVQMIFLRETVHYYMDMLVVIIVSKLARMMKN